MFMLGLYIRGPCWWDGYLCERGERGNRYSVAMCAVQCSCDEVQRWFGEGYYVDPTPVDTTATAAAGVLCQ